MDLGVQPYLVSTISVLHCVSKKSNLYSLLQFLHTQFYCDNFGTDVAKKVGNQNMRYFPISP